MLTRESLNLLKDFFNDKHEIIVCTCGADGVPNAALMGSCRLNQSGEIEFDLSDPKDVPAQTFKNLEENKHVLFMRFIPGPRARDYKGLRIYAEVKILETAGERLEAVRRRISEKHGTERAMETFATAVCEIQKIRPVLDRNQDWRESI